MALGEDERVVVAHPRVLRERPESRRRRASCRCVRRAPSCTWPGSASSPRRRALRAADRSARSGPSAAAAPRSWTAVSLPRPESYHSRPRNRDGAAARGHAIKLEKIINKAPSDPTVPAHRGLDANQTTVGLLSCGDPRRGDGQQRLRQLRRPTAGTGGEHRLWRFDSHRGGAGPAEAQRDWRRSVLSRGDACGGRVIGTWNVTSSCLTLSGDMDVTLASLGCKTVPVTGSLHVTGTWIANATGPTPTTRSPPAPITFPLAARVPLGFVRQRRVRQGVRARSRPSAGPRSRARTTPAATAAARPRPTRTAASAWSRPGR